MQRNGLLVVFKEEEMVMWEIFYHKPRDVI